MLNAQAIELLQLLARHESLSEHKATKRLGIGLSQLNRLLAALGNDPAFGGLDLVSVELVDDRRLLRLTARGDAALAARDSTALALLPAIGIQAGVARAIEQQVAEELPIALVYNGHSHAVMMATPQDLHDFALGFTFTEGIVEQAAEFQFIEALQDDRGVSIECLIPQQRFDRLRARQRNLIGTSGCGLCGNAALDQALRPVGRISSDLVVAADQISAAFEQLQSLQPLNAASGAVHAAGFCHAGGLLVREDVGRHNALDKVVGAMLRQEIGAGFVIITSRASYEVVHKAAQAGVAVLAAISAPTAMAVRLAESAGITLIAFARGDRMTVYSHPERLLGPTPQGP